MITAILQPIVAHSPARGGAFGCAQEVCSLYRGYSASVPYPGKSCATSCYVRIGLTGACQWDGARGYHTSVAYGAGIFLVLTLLLSGQSVARRAYRFCAGAELCDPCCFFRSVPSLCVAHASARPLVSPVTPCSRHRCGFRLTQAWHPCFGCLYSQASHKLCQLSVTFEAFM
jgi:hypothetical protein